MRRALVAVMKTNNLLAGSLLIAATLSSSACVAPQSDDDMGDETSEGDKSAKLFPSLAKRWWYLDQNACTREGRARTGRFLQDIYLVDQADLEEGAAHRMFFNVNIDNCIDGVTTESTNYYHGSLAFKQILQSANPTQVLAASRFERITTVNAETGAVVEQPIDGIELDVKLKSYDQSGEIYLVTLGGSGFEDIGWSILGAIHTDDVWTTKTTTDY